MKLKAAVKGQNFQFKSLTEVMAKANEEKSGDNLAKIAANNEKERVAAKCVLAEITLADIRENPLIPPEQDEVSKVIEENINEDIYGSIKGWTVGQLREWLLDSNTDNENIMHISKGLTSEMVAAVTKIMTNLDLILAASKIEVTAHCNTTIGRKGTLAARAQPNHPTDDVQGVLASLYEALSYGSGDAVIGINPVIDSVDNIYSLLSATKEVMQKWQIPTQNCVLGHVTTQMEAVKKGAPCDLIFQSIAGTQKANQSFGISVSKLDEAHDLILNEGSATGPNVMYFETGQGSELSAEAHCGVDQLTLEARCYGLARRYKPFMVNTVVGFIGPEYLFDNKQVIRAGLEDHFMGKLQGIPMGVDACYTNHMLADQNDIENLSLLLAQAGVNYLIGIPMGDDCMLSYQAASYHDIATLRELLGLRPIPIFEAWLEKLGLMENGKLTPKAGDPSIFLE